VIVADSFNHKIRLIYPNRTVITLAGGNSSGTAVGSTNGVGTAALFRYPHGVAVDTSGNVIVADSNNHKIRLVYPNRTVITLAGGSTTGTTTGSANGVGTAALFNWHASVAVDTSGNVIVADSSNHKIRLIYPFSCSPGFFANFTSRSCILCLPGSFSNASSAESCFLCLGGTFAKPFGSTSCEACPGGHYCPAGTSRATPCGAGNFCPLGSSVPTPCPAFGAVDAVKGPSKGPAFDVDTAACLNHCYFGGDGQLSIC
jgi:DNA-binding beta-propeller fold protein YncE